MTLRTAALIAGAIGVLLLAFGLIADAVKPAATASPTASLDTPVVVYTPDIVALAPEGSIAVAGTGEIKAYTARPVDADAWIASVPATRVTAIVDWDTLATTAVGLRPSPSPAASASPSAQGSPGASASTAPSASASASPSASPSAAPVEPLLDVWRDSTSARASYTVAVASIPTGLTLVIESADGTNLTATSMEISRIINDTWISNVTWWGIALTAIGLVALVALVIDIRPVQSKGESWLAQRSRIGKGLGAASPGSRRARRAEGVAMPEASLDNADDDPPPPHADSGDEPANRDATREDER